MATIANSLFSSQSFVRSGIRETTASSTRLPTSIFESPSSKRHIRPIAPVPYIRSDNPGSSPQHIPSSPLPSTPLSNSVLYQQPPIAFPVSLINPIQAQPHIAQHSNSTRLLPPAQPLRISKRNGSQRTPRCEPLSISHSHSKDSDRWSDVVPPESALFFAVVWDDNDEIVAFSPADIARHHENDSQTDVGHHLVDQVVEEFDEFDEDGLDVAFYALESENDDHWDGVDVEVEGASEYDEAESIGSATITPLPTGPGDFRSSDQPTPTTSNYPSLNSSTYLQIIRDHGHIMQAHTPRMPRAKTSRSHPNHPKYAVPGATTGVSSSSCPSLSSSIPLSSGSVHGMTRTSSTLGGLDVYLKGLPLKKTHRNQPFYSVLEFELGADLDARLRIDSITFGDPKLTKTSGSARESKFSLPWTTIEPPTAEEISTLLKERENAREKAGKRLKKRSRWALGFPQPEGPPASIETDPSTATSPSPPLPSSSPRKRVAKHTPIPLTAYLRPSPRFPCHVPTSSPPNSPPARLGPRNIKQGGTLNIGSIPNRLGGFPSLSRSSSSTLRARSTTPSNTRSSIRSRAPSHVHVHPRPTNPQAIYFERQSQNMADSESPVVGTGPGMGFCQPLFSNVFRFVGIGEHGYKATEGMGEWVMVDSGSLTGRLRRM